MSHGTIDLLHGTVNYTPTVQSGMFLIRKPEQMYRHLVISRKKFSGAVKHIQEKNHPPGIVQDNPNIPAQEKISINSFTDFQFGS